MNAWASSLVSGRRNARLPKPFTKLAPQLVRSAVLVPAHGASEASWLLTARPAMPSAAPMNCSTNSGLATCTSVLLLKPETWFSAGKLDDGWLLSPSRSAIVASYWVRVSSENGAAGDWFALHTKPSSRTSGGVTGDCVGAPPLEQAAASGSAQAGASKRSTRRMVRVWCRFPALTVVREKKRAL